jgi:hypothetical protein
LLHHLVERAPGASRLGNGLDEGIEPFALALCELSLLALVHHEDHQPARHDGREQRLRR